MCVATRQINYKERSKISINRNLNEFLLWNSLLSNIINNYKSLRLLLKVHFRYYRNGKYEIIAERSLGIGAERSSSCEPEEHIEVHAEGEVGARGCSLCSICSRSSPIFEIQTPGTITCHYTLEAFMNI